MESVMRTILVVLVVWGAGVARPAVAQEVDDGGIPEGMEPPLRDNPEAQGLPLACDGDLCDTSNDSLATSCECAIGRGHRAAAPANGLLLVLAALGLWAARRTLRRRAGQRIATITLVAVTLTARAAVAEPPPPVDVTIHEPPPPRRYVSIALNPLSLILTRLSFDIVVTPADHHAIVISSHYFWTDTAPVFVYDDQQNATQLPKQHFEGGGGELGYRYYFGKGGPRGWFVGGSLLLSWITATAENGRQVPYLNAGGAIDAGYQILIVNRVSLNMGLGLQYTANNKDIPKQQFPSMLQTNGGVLPRFLLSLGFAL